MTKILELFGGIGAPRKALVNLGVQHKSIDYVEWNEKAVRTYNAMFDNRYQPESVVGYDLKPDILVHGSPCQDFSIAGKQYGGNIEDGTRSSLLFETTRIIENMGVWRPELVVWENVPNVLSKRMKGAFHHYLDEMRTYGYSHSYEVLDAREFGIPQARKRIIVVSRLNKGPFNFAQLEKKPMQNIWEFVNDKFEEQHIITQPSMVRKLPGKEVPGTYGGRILSEITEFAWTITTKQMRSPNSGVVRINDDQFRYLTERECWRLMGFDDNDFEAALKEHPGQKGKLNGTLYHQAGNSIVVDLLEAIFKAI